jgi:hypothetical protein
MSGIEILSPLSTAGAGDSQSLAPRLQSTQGKTLGVVCNGLGNSETFFDELIVQLQELGGFARVVKVVKDSKSVPPTDAQWDQLRGIDVAVTGFGGCGSCSTRAARDALELEWQGVPSIYIGHPALRPAVAAIVKLSGHPDYPQILGKLDPPIAAWPDEAAQALARELAPAVHRAMLDPVSWEVSRIAEAAAQQQDSLVSAGAGR